MSIAPSVILGEGVLIYHPHLVNLYGCTVGAGTRIGAFVEIQKRAFVGCNCKIQSHTFICEGVHLGDNVFIGHGVMFINDRDPSSCNLDGKLKADDDWKCEDTYVEDNASIGSGAVIMCGVTLGTGCLIGAGAVVTKNVPANAIVAGCPARLMRYRDDNKQVVEENDHD